MKIYIDADGCPVVRNTLKIAEKFNIPCVVICDTSHRIEHKNAEVIVVDKGADSVDFRLVNLIQKDDIAVTQDYGLAAMCLSKQAVVLNQDGKEYTNENISGLLEFRAVSKKIRQSGGRLKGMPRRTDDQDRKFEEALKNLLKLKGTVMNIRIMTINDYEEVYELWFSCKGMGLNNLDDSKEGIERFLKRNPETCFVSETDNKIVGVIIAGNDGRRGYIYHTAVHPDYRHRGIASKLVKTVISELKAIGIHKAALVVFERNTAGNEFWEKIGFTMRDDLVYRNFSLSDITRIDT